MDRFTEHIGSMRRRNPSILADRASGLYYLYTPSALLDDDSGGAVVVQASADLMHWSAPQVALSAGREFRGTPDIRSQYFQYNDQATLGRPDGENYQIGAVDVCHKPNREFVEGCLRTHERMYDVADGTEPAADVKLVKIISNIAS